VLAKENVATRKADMLHPPLEALSTTPQALALIEFLTNKRTCCTAVAALLVTS